MGDNRLNILFIGDIIGRKGRNLLEDILPELKKENKVDLVIANGENAAAGFGLTQKIYNKLLEIGIDVVTTGNHVWDIKDFINEIADCPKVVRPANYPPGVPGKGHLTVEVNKIKIAVINLSGRVFMPSLDCPFRKAEEILKELPEDVKVKIVDIHGEATSEKTAMGWFLDGKVSAVIGTHTHVQTADEKVLPQGTAYITDVGMAGAYNSVIGVEVAPILQRFLTSMPTKFEAEKKGPGLFNAVLLTVDSDSGKAEKIKRIYDVIEDEPSRD